MRSASGQRYQQELQERAKEFQRHPFYNNYGPRLFPFEDDGCRLEIVINGWRARFSIGCPMDSMVPHHNNNGGGYWSAFTEFFQAGYWAPRGDPARRTYASFDTVERPPVYPIGDHFWENPLPRTRIPANPRRSTNVGQRRRRWIHVKPATCRCLLFVHVVGMPQPKVMLTGREVINGGPASAATLVHRRAAESVLELRTPGS